MADDRGAVKFKDLKTGAEAEVSQVWEDGGAIGTRTSVSYTKPGDVKKAFEDTLKLSDKLGIFKTLERIEISGSGGASDVTLTIENKGQPGLNVQITHHHGYTDKDREDTFETIAEVEAEQLIKSVRPK